MSIEIFADSCCDCTPAMRNILGLTTIPLVLRVPGTGEYIDNDALDTQRLVEEMKLCKEATGTACPSPEAYAALMREADACFVVTLSSKLSGSYGAAMTGRELALEEYPDKKICVVDSESASAGELRLVIALREWIDEGLVFEEIEARVTELVARMKTLFVLEDLGNLVKNGRISKAAGLLGGMLGLRPIMGENGHGEIICLEKVRGTAKSMTRLVEYVQDFTKGCKNLTLVLSYCNCMERAQELKKMIADKCAAIAEIILVPTRGVSTVYANNGGVVLAF
ncbi:MAG: DegV family protein [Oscillospiraceae bacterium]|nr:DegV family protein [Oscillospiraceae bacterium]